MKKVFIAVLMLIMPAAHAEDFVCPDGKSCGVVINCTTKEVTYTINDPMPSVAEIRPEPIVPTHQIAVSSGNQSWGTAGTVEQITQAVKSLTPVPVTVDPCLNGGCTKVDINIATGVTTISPLSEQDLKQRAKDQAAQSKSQAELARDAFQSLPNIQAYVQPTRETSTALTDQDETITPDWWNEWISSWNLFVESYSWWWAL
jgi:hypothetical protein